jgi:hypothetical protein
VLGLHRLQEATKQRLRPTGRAPTFEPATQRKTEIALSGGYNGRLIFDHDIFSC